MWDNFRLTGNIVGTPASGSQSTLENIDINIITVNEDMAGDKIIGAGAAGVSLPLIDPAPSNGTFFVLFTDQPLNVYINGSVTATPCDRILVLSASTVVGSLITQIDVDNLSVTTDANVRYYFIK